MNNNILIWTANRLFELLEVEPCPIIFMESSQFRGEYKYEEEVIFINENLKVSEALEVIAHEIRHRWQHKNNLLDTRIKYGVSDFNLPYHRRWQELDANEFSIMLNTSTGPRWIPSNTCLSKVLDTMEASDEVKMAMMVSLVETRYEYMSLRPKTSYKDFIDFLYYKKCITDGERMLLKGGEHNDL